MNLALQHNNQILCDIALGERTVLKMLTEFNVFMVLIDIDSTIIYF